MRPFGLSPSAWVGLLTGAMAFLSSVAHAQFLQLDFSVQWMWRYDLTAGQMDPTFSSFSMPLTAYVDPTLSSSTTLGASTRQSFGPVVFVSPYSSLVNLGVDVTSGSFPTIDSHGFVQDTYITDSNQGTWTDLYQALATPAGTYSFSLQYTGDPRLSDPTAFGSTEYLNFLSGHVGVVFSFREDVVAGGTGWQSLGNATLLAATPVTQIPEPATYGALMAGVAGLLVSVRRLRRPSGGSRAL